MLKTCREDECTIKSSRYKELSHSGVRRISTYDEQHCDANDAVDGVFGVRSRGFSFVELLIGTAVIALFFGGLFGAIQYSVKVIALSKAKSGALAIANERIEYLRSLIYADVGTVSGIPSGAMPQNATTSLNSILYSTRTLIEYVDAPDDGVGGADANGILADFKRAKVEVSWDIGYGTTSMYLVSDIVPAGIETTDGGGTLTVNVFDADVQPLPGIPVRIYNDTTTSTIDVTKSTNASGVAMFSGAPAAANYQITVTDTGYSTDGTRMATTSLPNPATPPVAVIEGAVSTMNFQVDELSELTVRTVGPATYGTFADAFDDTTLVASTTDVVVSLGSVVLSGAPGSYASTGSLLSTSTSPASLDSWSIATWSGTTTLLATIRVQVYSVTGTSTYTLVPDTDLAGNSAGFTASTIDLTGIDASTYDTLALGAVLATSDTNVTPELGAWDVTYVTNEPTIPGIDFVLTGGKVLGTDLALVPIPKYDVAHATDGSGSVTIPDLEWDSYDVVLMSPGYDVSEACRSLPYSLSPGVVDTLTLTLVPSVAHSLRVEVVDGIGDPIPNASVTLSRSGFSDSDTASVCGQVFFGSGVSSNTDYEVEVEATGYIDQTITGVSIDGASILRVTLST